MIITLETRTADGRTPRADLRSTLLSMGMTDGAQYLIREYALPLRPEDYFGVMRSAQSGRLSA